MNQTKEYYNLKRKILVNLIAAGSALVTIIVNSSLMKFFTDVIGLSPALYGIVFVIFSIWNGVNDPILGYFADNRPYKKGQGKYRNLIRWSIPVIAFSLIPLFFTSPSWSEIAISIFLLVMLIIYEGAQTVIGVSMLSFTMNTFLSTEERTEMQVLSSYISMIPFFLGGMIPVWFLTGEYSLGALVSIFTFAIIIGLALIWIGTLFMKEDDNFYGNVETTHNIKELWALSKDFMKDKTFVLFMIAFFFIQAGSGNYFTGYLYYMDNVLNVSGLKATIPDLLTGVVQMALFPIIIAKVSKYGCKEVLWKGLLISVAGHFVLSLPINYWIASLAYIVILAGYGFNSSIYNPFVGIIVDHIEIKTGKRQPGVVKGIMSILLVPAASLQPLILSVMLGASGYVGGVSEQTPEVVQAIRLGTGVIPGVILLIGIILLGILPITHKKELDINSIIKEKYTQKEELPIH